MNLHDLNNISFNVLNQLANDRIEAQPLFFSTIRSSECFDFLCHEWIKQNHNRPFKFTENQTALLALLKSNKHLLIPKDRQVGETLATSIYLTHEFYYNHKDIIVIGPRSQDVKHVIGIIRFMVSAIIKRDANLNPQLDQGYLNNLYTLELFGRKIKGAWTESRLRSEHADIVYLSAAEFIRNGMDILGVTLGGTLKQNGQMIISSSYNGLNGFMGLLLAENQRVPRFTVFPMSNPNTNRNDPDNWPFR